MFLRDSAVRSLRKHVPAHYKIRTTHLCIRRIVAAEQLIPFRLLLDAVRNRS